MAKKKNEINKKNKKSNKEQAKTSKEKIDNKTPQQIREEMLKKLDDSKLK